MALLSSSDEEIVLHYPSLIENHLSKQTFLISPQSCLRIGISPVTECGATENIS